MNKFLLMTLMIGVILFISTSCDEESTGLNYGKIEGKVFDPIMYGGPEGIEITTQPPTSAVQTNGTGYYEIINVMPGQYEIKFSAIGYKTKTVFVTVNSGKTTKADISLEQINGKSGSDDDEK